jgi:hypothetical protein
VPTELQAVDRRSFVGGDEPSSPSPRLFLACGRAARNLFVRLAMRAQLVCGAMFFVTFAGAGLFACSIPVGGSSVSAIHITGDPEL